MEDLIIHQWGMVIDLDRCTGCQVCVTACAMENNSPTVGEDEVAYGRGMHWMRIHREWHGEYPQASQSHRPMLCMHEEHGADLTLAVMNVAPEETSRFGIMLTDESGRVIKFYEKPKDAPSTLANMGVYVFNANALIERLRALSPAHPDLDLDLHRLVRGILSRHDICQITRYRGGSRSKSRSRSGTEGQ